MVTRAVLSPTRIPAGTASFHAASKVGGTVLTEPATVLEKNSRRAAITARAMAAVASSAVSARSSRSAGMDAIPFVNCVCVAPRNVDRRPAPVPEPGGGRSSQITEARHEWRESSSVQDCVVGAGRGRKLRIGECMRASDRWSRCGPTDHYSADCAPGLRPRPTERRMSGRSIN